MYLVRYVTFSIYAHLAMIIFPVINCLIPGIIAGLLVSRDTTSKKDAVVPGIIAGSITAFANIIIDVISIITLGQGNSPFLSYLLWNFAGTLIIFVILACVCSSLTVFFTAKIYWTIPSEKR